MERTWVVVPGPGRTRGPRYASLMRIAVGPELAWSHLEIFVGLPVTGTSIDGFAAAGPVGGRHEKWIEESAGLEAH